jgi:glucose-6-phosphate isomerase
MKTLSIAYQDTCAIDYHELEFTATRLSVETERIKQARQYGYDTDYAMLWLAYDRPLLERIQQVAAHKKTLQPTMLVVVGIGGSNLGALAIHEALHGRFYNEKQVSLKVYFADTVDNEQTAAQLFFVEQELQRGNAVIINVITKSGSTTETIANFELFFALVQQYRPHNFNDYIVITTDTHSPLVSLAHELDCTLLEVPRQVGGRYSVFSAVGLFPLAMLSVDLEQLLAGARHMMNASLRADSGACPAAMSALIKYHHYQHDMPIHDLFIFAVNLTTFGLWYRQLMGESIGKEFNRDNEQVYRGITPTVSIGTADLHSVGQLYLGGPRNKVTTFLTIEHHAHDLTLPVMPSFEALVPKIQGKSFATLINAIINGTQAAYQQQDRPFMTIVLPEISSFYLGQLFQLYMLEMIYLGFLLDVNPFDQPHVELYKHVTKQILAQN